MGGEERKGAKEATDDRIKAVKETVLPGAETGFIPEPIRGGKSARPA